MKAVINGGLNLSTLDGWWAEAYDGTNGWALSGEVDPNSSAQDARDDAALFELLEHEVLPAFTSTSGRLAWLSGRWRCSPRFAATARR